MRKTEGSKSEDGSGSWLMNPDPGRPTLILRLHILGMALLPVAWPRPKGGLSERLMQVGLLPASSKTTFSF
jgi:hypothetical protein